MKRFTVFANCQGLALATVLMSNRYFAKLYTFTRLPAVQTLTEADVPKVENLFAQCDLVIFQNVRENYKIPELSTARLLQKIRPDALAISFPSLYFNGYFPHIDNMQGVKSILNLVHDYFIVFAFLQGMTISQAQEFINQDDLYSPQLSTSLFRESLTALQERENSLHTDCVITSYLEKEYSSVKLFNQFNHPSIEVFLHLAQQICDKLQIETEFDLDAIMETYKLDRISTPIYPSTHRHLKLNFKEEFGSYATIQGPMSQEKVIEEYYKTYSSMERSFLENMLHKKKPFIAQLG